MSNRIPGSEIEILLSTFDGARFLPEQLASIAGQSFPGWRLLWRDDGSADNTVALVNGFACQYPPGQVVELPSSGKHLGVFDSFMTLIGNASDAAVVALADQDDIWLPVKLERAFRAIGKVEPSRPALYCTSVTVVDAALRPVGESVKLRHTPGFPGALLQNIASGCTMVFNQAAVRLIGKAAKPSGVVHDWWIYLLVAATGGEIVFDDMPTMLYRQHDRNAIGASWSTSMARRIAGAAVRGTGPYNALLRRLLDALHQNEAMLTAANAATLRQIQAAFSGAWWQRVSLLAMPGFRRQTHAQDVALVLCLLQGSRRQPGLP